MSSIVAVDTFYKSVVVCGCHWMKSADMHGSLANMFSVHHSDILLIVSEQCKKPGLIGFCLNNTNPI